MLNKNLFTNIKSFILFQQEKAARGKGSPREKCSLLKVKRNFELNCLVYYQELQVELALIIILLKMFKIAYYC